MACETIGGCALENAILVALAAINIEMSTRQFESRKIMVKCCRFPVGSGMT
jgi:hypothetical protein